MKDTNLVKTLRLKCGGGKKMERDVIGAMRTAFEQSADRIVAAEGYALVLKKEIEKLRAQLRHLGKLAEADKDGRLVVLPCKVGDTIYHISKVRTSHFEDDKIIIDDEGRWKIYEMPFALIHLPYIGKSYFLTREEAEKALEAMKK